MPTEKEKKLKKLEDLFKMVNDSLTKTEFLSAFQSVVKQVLKLEKDLILKLDTKTSESVKNLDEITATYRETVQRIEEDNKTGLSNLKKFAITKVTDLFVKRDIDSKLKTKFKEIDTKLGDARNEVNERLALIHDGVDADEEKMIERLSALIPAPVEIPTFEVPKEITNTIKDLETENEKQQEEIEELKKRPIGRGGGTSAIGVAQAFKYIAHTEALTGAIDGANKVYTVKVDIWWIAGFTLNGENIAELPNFTFANKVITFSSALPAAYSGKDFEIKYIG